MSKEHDIQKVQSEYLRALLKAIHTKSSRKPSLEEYDRLALPSNYREHADRRRENNWSRDRG